MARPYGCRELADVSPDPCNSRSAELPAPAATVCEKKSDPDADLGLVTLQALQIAEDVLDDAPVLRLGRCCKHGDHSLILLLQLQVLLHGQGMSESQHSQIVSWPSGRYNKKLGTQGLTDLPNVLHAV